MFRLPEDYTLVTKHVGVILTMNCVLGCVLFLFYEVHLLVNILKIFFCRYLVRYTSGNTNLPYLLLSHLPVALLHPRVRSTSTSTTIKLVSVAKETEVCMQLITQNYL